MQAPLTFSEMIRICFEFIVDFLIFSINFFYIFCVNNFFCCIKLKFCSKMWCYAGRKLVVANSKFIGSKFCRHNLSIPNAHVMCDKAWN